MLIKFGAIVTDGRGKLGGHVLAKNRSGNYMRTKVTPVNPQTTFQQEQRAALGTLSSGWSGLTDVQRNAWNGAVASFQKTNIFGDLKTPTGKNLFTGLNKNILNSNGTILVSPPSPSSIPSASVTSAELSIGGASFDVVIGGDTTGATVQVWATPALSAGTSFIKNRLRLVQVAVGSLALTADIYTAYVDRFGVPPIGANVSVAIRVVNAGGEAGVQSTFKGSVIA